MKKLDDIFENESQEKAYQIYALVALKMTKIIYHKLPENMQQIVDDAHTYWTNNADLEISEKKMDDHASLISKLRSKSDKRFDINGDLELKVVELCLSISINPDYFDYHLDWMYEVGNRIGFSSPQLNDLINETINELN